MRVTEVTVKRVPDQGALKAFASIVLDDELVVHDLKVLDGSRGLFVAMPSRKVCDRCPACSHKNPLVQRYCGGCGKRQQDGRGQVDPEHGRVKWHVDVWSGSSSFGGTNSPLYAPTTARSISARSVLPSGWQHAGFPLPTKPGHWSYCTKIEVCARCDWVGKRRREGQLGPDIKTEVG